MTIMPGLIDVHFHLDLIGHSNYAYRHKTYSSRWEEIVDMDFSQTPSIPELRLTGIVRRIEKPPT